MLLACDSAIRVIVHSYMRHRMAAAGAFHHGQPVLIMSTYEYWRQLTSNPNDTAFAFQGEKMRRKVLSESRLYDCTYQLWLADGTLVVPVSDALNFDGTMPCSAQILCSHCGVRGSYSDSVSCDLCLASVWCSDHCRRQGSHTHETLCSQETKSVKRITRLVREKRLWPFRVECKNGQTSIVICSLSDTELARCRSPSSAMLKTGTIQMAASLIRNKMAAERIQGNPEQSTILVWHHLLDFEKQAARAESMATQLLEEERQEEASDRAKTHRKGRRSRKKKGSDTMVHHQTPRVLSCSTTTNTPLPVPDLQGPTPELSIVSEPLAELICPITQSVMSDPVVIQTGHTFERSAILTWFERSSTNPLTGATLADTQLIPNITVRGLCENYQMLHVGSE